MLKSEIDSYTQSNILLLRNVANDFVRRRKKNYDPDILVSEAYIHVIKCKDEIESIGQLQAYYISKISMECTMEKSKTNYNHKKQITVDLTGVEKQVDDDIDCKIQTEKRFDIISSYEKNLKDPIKKIIFDAYFNKKYSTVRTFAKYFNLSNATANGLINDLKTEIRNYGKEIESGL